MQDDSLPKHLPKGDLDGITVHRTEAKPEAARPSTWCTRAIAAPSTRVRKHKRQTQPYRIRIALSGHRPTALDGITG